MAEALRSNLNEAQAQAAFLRQRLVQAEQLALLDGLTSLPNHRHFQQLIEEAVSEAHASYTPLCILMADIVYFKKINDSFGHPTGDAVLKQFAEIMAKSVRATDLVARYGGKEFALEKGRRWATLSTLPSGSARTFFPRPGKTRRCQASA
jgi:PleD family two-component response regulator